MIDRRTRSIILTVSAVLCAVGMCLLPIAGESALQIHTAQRLFDTRFTNAPEPAASEDALPERDPFEPDSVQQVTRNAPQAKVSIAVRAVVAGADPRALIEDGGHMRIVQPGDPVRSSTVRAISTQGVVLADGTKLPLEAMP